VHECEYFDIESILPSGKGEGSYTVTLRNVRANLNRSEEGEEHGLVLNTNTENVPMLITSTRLTLGSKLSPSANSIIMKPNSSVDISMAQVIKEYQAGYVSAMRIKPGDNVTADWVWSCKPGMLTPTGVVSSVEAITALSSGLNTQIRVTAGSTEGNAVVAAKVNDVIVWSWHIWVTDYDPETNPLHFQSTGVPRLEAPDAGKDHIFMDRNMGALDNKPGDDPRKAFGLFYQWGRKDPFAGNWSMENTVEGRAVIYTRSNPQGEPQPIKHLMMTAGVRYSIENPQDFVSVQNPMTGAWSWNDLSMESLARLWYDGTDVSSHVTKSVYDPCPAGWRMPARGVLEGFQVALDKETARANKGHLDTPFGYVPYAGYVDKDGVMHHDEGVYAFYTSQADIPIWFSRWADGVRYETTGGSKTTMNAANTYSVRCQKED
jgi:hypothetical protein